MLMPQIRSRAILGLFINRVDWFQAMFMDTCAKKDAFFSLQPSTLEYPLLLCGEVWAVDHTHRDLQFANK